MFSESKSKVSEEDSSPREEAFSVFGSADGGSAMAVNPTGLDDSCACMQDVTSWSEMDLTLSRTV